jgi:predicted dehydrogenase
VVRIGILGAGSVVELYHLPVLRNFPGASIRWICDRDEARARRLRRVCRGARVYTRIDECPDVDVVLVAIPVGYRRDPLRHIFRSGWHALCEKPFAVTLAEHDAILADAAQSGVQVAVGLMRRYYRSTILARRLIRSGAFGAVEEVWAAEGARMLATGREEGWYQSDRQAAGGGVLMETGSHLIDQAFTILDVSGFAPPECRQTVFKDIDLETRAVSELEIPGSRRIKFTVAVSRLNDLQSGIQVRLSNAILKVGVLPDAPLTVLGRDGAPLGRIEEDRGASHVYQAFYLEWEDFVIQCTSGRPSAVRAETARQGVAFIEACYRNAATTANRRPLA